MDESPKLPMHLKVLAGVGLVFGVLTVVSGGTALFGPAAATDALGNIVPFVLWFNFLAGFAYVAAGLGLLLRKDWAVGLSLALFVATFLILVGFAVHVVTGGPYEMRTVGALLLRTAVWATIVLFARRASWYRHRDNVLRVSEAPSLELRACVPIPPRPLLGKRNDDLNDRNAGA